MRNRLLLLGWLLLWDWLLLAEKHQDMSGQEAASPLRRLSLLVKASAELLSQSLQGDGRDERRFTHADLAGELDLDDIIDLEALDDAVCDLA